MSTKTKSLNTSRGVRQVGSILTRWETYSDKDVGIYVVNGIKHNVKELYESAMTRIDSEGGLWYSELVQITPNDLTMSELVSMTESHYTDMDLSPGFWEKMGYKRVETFKAAKEELVGQASDKKERRAEYLQTMKVELPLWMNDSYAIMGKEMTGLDMFTQASVVIDSCGTSWHFTDVEFATLAPSPKYLTNLRTEQVAWRNMPLNNKSPEELSKAILAWYQ